MGQETSPDSPITQVAEFPSEFILLGRATVMIKVRGGGDEDDDDDDDDDKWILLVTCITTLH